MTNKATTRKAIAKKDADISFMKTEITIKTMAKNKLEHEITMLYMDISLLKSK